MNQSVLFVCGIDTDVGKTIATAVYARKLAEQGKRVITQKVVQTGCKGIAEDILKHRQIQEIALTEYDKNGITCPYVFDYPCSPHQAAEREGHVLNPDVITAATDKLLNEYEQVLLEGAGGLMSPLTRELTQLDYVTECGYPIMLVTSGKLGSINHTLLSFQAALSRNIPVQCVVYNRFFNTDQQIGQETEQFLHDYTQRHFPNCEWMVLEPQKLPENLLEP